ncbi:MAG TPA: UvrD-helicase domain-containing protein [Candidatus Nanoarchaeia archaeon]|nr:UvrD-helicase domain-containing protein [Candidatus Nanoarchaeia archaeon]
MTILSRLFKIVRKEDKLTKKSVKKTAKLHSSKKAISQFKDEELFSGLDDGQKKAVVSDNKRTLVLAGAGAGKTRVLLHRIIHLIRNKEVNAGNILSITFTVDATQEMRDRLTTYFEPKYANLKTKKVSEEDLKQVQKEIKERNPELRAIWISTIHSLCYTILRTDGAKVFNTHFKVIGDEEKQTEKYKSKITQQKVIKYLIDGEAKNDPEFIEQVKSFILDYLVDYEKIAPDRISYKKSKYITLRGEEVKSKSERDIANFLFQHDIKYMYEPLADWVDKDDSKKSYHPDFYLPEYRIYIEHWYVSSPDDKVTDKSFDKERYLKERDWKLDQYKKHKKCLIESFESLMQGKLSDYYNYLYKEIYRETNGAIKLRPSTEFIGSFKHLKSGLDLFITSVMKIINLAKSNRVSTPTIKENIKDEKHEEVSRFYNLLIPLYDSYEDYLEKKSLIDYNDMIHLVIKLFKSEPNVLTKYQKRFQHILVDEYQDVSAAQVELIKLLLTEENNLFAVGDDWQSIYGFRGSEVEFIVNFEKEFKGSEKILLPYNYRSANDIVEASNIVIKKNPNQVDKDIKAFNSSNSEKIFQFNALNEIDGANFILQKTKKLYSDGYKFKDVLFLYRRTRHWVPYGNFFKKREFIINKKTIHSSKGLEAKVVFLVGLSCGSFPYVWEDSRIIQVIKKCDLTKKEEEERRVFYVGMTRAKEKLFLISERNNESEFCTDIPDEFKIVEISKAEFSEEMLSDFLKKVYSMVNAKKTTEEIAKEIGKQSRDVEVYIAKFIETGLLDVKDFVEDKTYEVIKKAIPEKLEAPWLASIKKRLPSNITYGQIRYVIADSKKTKNET